MNYAAAAAALLVGAAISFADYKILEFFISRKQSNPAVGSFVRQIINIAYIFLLYFIGKKTGLDVRFLLIGGAIGITVPSFFFTARILKKQDSANGKDKEDNNG